MRVALYSPPVFAQTGYGRQGYLLLGYLVSRGFECYNLAHVPVLVWGGLVQVRSGEKTIPVIQVEGPRPWDAVRSWVESLGVDVVVTLYDCFMIGGLADRLSAPVLAWTPVDALVTGRVLEHLSGVERVVAMSRYGYEQLLRFLKPSTVSYIPHFIDTRAYKPVESDLKVRLGLGEDSVLFATVAVNQGERKLLPLLVRTFKRLVDGYEEGRRAYLYLHTDPSVGYPRGYDLSYYARELGVGDRVLFPSTPPAVLPMTDEEMAWLYSGADFYVSASMGEGFGLPLLEAQACGTPVICPRNSSQEELNANKELLADCVPSDVYVDIPVWVPTLQEYTVPDARSLLEKMRLAVRLRRGGRYGELSRRAREHALAYDVNNVAPMWVKLINNVLG